MAPKKGKKASAPSKVASMATKTKIKAAKARNTIREAAKTPPPTRGTERISTVSSPRGQASTSQSSNQSSKRPVTSVRVPATARANDDNGLGDLTVEEGVPGDRTASLAFQSLLVTANSQLDLHMTIRNYVPQHFFKHVKFITRSQKLA
jgi:cytoskeletal protein RodZ